MKLINHFIARRAFNKRISYSCLFLIKSHRVQRKIRSDFHRNIRRPSNIWVFELVGVSLAIKPLVSAVSALCCYATVAFRNLERCVFKVMSNLRYMKSVQCSHLRGFHSSLNLPMVFLLLASQIICPFVWGCTTETYFPRQLRENLIYVSFRELAFTLFFSPFVLSHSQLWHAIQAPSKWRRAVSNREKCSNWKHKIGPTIKGCFSYSTSDLLHPALIKKRAILKKSRNKKEKREQTTTSSIAPYWCTLGGMAGWDFCAATVKSYIVFIWFLWCVHVFCHL